MMIRSIPVIDQCSDIQMSDLSEIDSLSIPQILRQRALTYLSRWILVYEEESG